MPADTIEVIFSFSRDRIQNESRVIHFLKIFGFSRGELVQTAENHKSQIRVYCTSLRRAASLQKAFRKADFANVVLIQRRLTYADWAEKWKEDYRIQPLGQRFVVIPEWRRKEYRSDLFKKRIPLWIDPLSAFGSGEHETTRLMTSMLERLRGRFQSFLDVGTGTGILSVVAAHCGAQTIVGFDNDKPSADCAAINFKRNIPNFSGAQFYCGELARFRPFRKFDLVAANINSHILENYRRQIVSAAKSGGWVLVSGILKQTYQSFREAFDGPELRCLRILRGRRWISVLFQKNSKA